MIYVDKSFIVPLSNLAKENSFIHKHVTKDFDFSVSLLFRACEFKEMKSKLCKTKIKTRAIKIALNQKCRRS